MGTPVETLQCLSSTGLGTSTPLYARWTNKSLYSSLFGPAPCKIIEAYFFTEAATSSPRFSFDFVNTFVTPALQMATLYQTSSGMNFVFETDQTSGAKTIMLPSAMFTHNRWYHFVGRWQSSGNYRLYLGDTGIQGSTGDVVGTRESFPYSSFVDFNVGDNSAGFKGFNPISPTLNPNRGNGAVGRLWSQDLDSTRMKGGVADLRLWTTVRDDAEIDTDAGAFVSGGSGDYAHLRHCFRLNNAVTVATDVADAGVTNIEPTTVSSAGWAFDSHPFAGPTFEGSGAFTLTGVTASGVGAESFSGSGSATLNAPTAAGAGNETFSGSGAPTLTAPTVVGTGLHTEQWQGSGAATLPAPTAVGTATLSFEGSGAATLSGLSVAGTGDAPTLAEVAHKRIGVTIAERQWDGGLLLPDNLLYNGTFGPRGFRMIFQAADAVTSGTVVQQRYWLSGYNSTGEGHPEDFWNGATFEVLRGSSKGVTGTVTDYHHVADDQEPEFTLSTSVTLAVGDEIVVRRIDTGVCMGPAVEVDSVPIDAPPRDNTAGGLIVQDNQRITWYLDADSVDADTDIGGSLDVTVDWTGTGTCTIQVQRLGTPSYNQSQVASSTGETKSFTGIPDNGVIQVDLYPSGSTLGVITNAEATCPRSWDATIVALAPGSIRHWDRTILGMSFDQWWNGTGTSGYQPKDRIGDYHALPVTKVLSLCTAAGAHPYIHLPPAFTDAELASAAAALEATSFGRIFVSFANESWGGGGGNDPFQGGSFSGMPAVLEITDDRLAIFKAALTASEVPRFTFIANGQSPVPSQQAIITTSTEADAIELGPYWGREKTLDEFGAIDLAPLRAEADLQDEMIANLAELTLPAVIYEFNDHDQGTIDPAVVNAYLATPQAGLIAAQHALEHLALGVTTQVWFQLVQGHWERTAFSGDYIDLWGMYETIDDPRPMVSMFVTLNGILADDSVVSKINNNGDQVRFMVDETLVILDYAAGTLTTEDLTGEFFGSGVMTLSGPTVDGAAEQQFLGSGVATLPAPSGTGAGVLVPEGVGAMTIGAPQFSGTGVMTLGSFEGSGVMTLSGVTVSGTGSPGLTLESLQAQIVQLENLLVILYATRR